VAQARPTILIFLAASGLVVAGFAAVVALLDRYGTYVAESFGDRRLASPTTAECQIARVLLSDLRDRRLTAPLSAAGLAGRPVELRVFAWRSTGVRTPGQGADWRKCPGLGPFVRHLGMTRLASGALGLTTYISRATFDRGGDEATVWETFAPRPAFDPHGSDPPVSTAAWTVRLRRNRSADS